MKWFIEEDRKTMETYYMVALLYRGIRVVIQYFDFLMANPEYHNHVDISKLKSWFAKPQGQTV